MEDEREEDERRRREKKDKRKEGGRKKRGASLGEKRLNCKSQAGTERNLSSSLSERRHPVTTTLKTAKCSQVTIVTHHLEKFP